MWSLPDGRVLLASASDDHTVRLWDPGTGHQVGELLTGHTTGVRAVCAPIEVLRMLVTATEIGYLAALNDLRSGDLDDQTATERPDLIGQ